MKITITLTRNDLVESAKDKSIQEIGINDFNTARSLLTLYNKADEVDFIDLNGSLKILKRR